MRSLSILFIIGLIFCSCNHHAEGFDAYFCTTTESDKQRFLYIDDNRIGELPYTDHVPDCGEVQLNNNLLYTGLSAGRHSIEVRDNTGEVLFYGKMKAKHWGSSSSITTNIKKRHSNIKVKVKDGCLVVEIIQ